MTDAPWKWFIIDLTYTAPLSEIDATIPDHVTYLDEGYSAGVFLASGRKSPRTGGVIIATETTLDAIRKRAESDPFIRNNLAELKITEFHPNKGIPGLIAGR